MDSFSFNDSSVQVNGTVIISNVLDATIMRSSFQNNTLAGQWSSSGIPPDDIIGCCRSGGVHVFNSSLRIYLSVFSDNVGYITGGVYGVNSNITITESIFSRNRGFQAETYCVDRLNDGNAGALFVSSGTLQVLNGNFSNNIGSTQSGAVFFEHLKLLEITGSTF